jgi:hypothetical protein
LCESSTNAMQCVRDTMLSFEGLEETTQKQKIVM